MGEVVAVHALFADDALGPELVERADGAIFVAAPNPEQDLQRECVADRGAEPDELARRRRQLCKSPCDDAIHPWRQKRAVVGSGSIGEGAITYRFVDAIDARPHGLHHKSGIPSVS